MSKASRKQRPNRGESDQDRLARERNARVNADHRRVLHGVPGTIIWSSRRRRLARKTLRVGPRT